MVDTYPRCELCTLKEHCNICGEINESSRHHRTVGEGWHEDRCMDYNDPEWPTYECRAPNHKEPKEEK